MSLTCRGARRPALRGPHDVLYGLIRLRALVTLGSIALLPFVGGCASFATVRSAEVMPGPSVAVQASASTPPGEVAGWFWAGDCVNGCDHRVVGGDVGFTYGMRRSESARALALGVGLSGMSAYLDGYLQLGGGRQPFGIGARFGPSSSWGQHQLYGRYDVRLGSTTRLLLNPAIFLHEGTAPNGENPGSFLAFVQGIGILFEGKRTSFTPAIALVAGRAKRNSYGTQYGPERSVFGTASLALTFHRRRAPRP